MAREFSVVVGINASKAVAGGRTFKAGADQVNRSNRQMQRSTAGTTKRMTAMITTIGRLRGVMSVMFAGFLGVGGIGAVIRTLSQFQASMSNVKALLGDRGVGGAMDALTTKARQLGATTAFTASQAAEGMKFLTLAGFDALETFQAIGPALQLAQAGALGLGQAADIVSNIMQGFSIEASRTGEVVDALAFVASRTNTNIQQLGEAMKFVAPVAGALKLSVQEVSAALGHLGNSGLQASLAGTGLRRVLSGLLNPSKEANKVLAQMGLSAEDLVNALQDPNKGLTFVLKELEQSGISAAQAFTLFGQRGAPAVLSLVSQVDDLEKFNEQMQDIAGTAATIGAVMIDNLAGDARIAISAVQEAILRLGDAGLTEWLEETTQAFTAWIRGMSGVEQSLEGSSAKIQKWARAGIWMRENVDLLRKALVLLVVYMNRSLLVAFASGVVAFARMSAVVIGLARTFGIAGAAGVLLTTKMVALRAAIISTGVGALVVAAGFLLDWILFSEDAEDQNDKTTASFKTQSREIENLAFHFAELTAEEQKAAAATLATHVAQQTAALATMERQVINNTRGLELKREATAALELAEKNLGEVLRFNTTLTSDQFKVGSESHRLLVEREKATRDLQYAEDLLSTAQGVSLAVVAEKRKVVEDLNLRLAAQQAVVDGTVKSVEEYIAKMNGAKDAAEEFSKALQDQLGIGKDQLVNIKNSVEEHSKLQKKIADLEAELSQFNLSAEQMAAIEKEMGLEAGTLTRVIAELEHELKKAKEELSPLQKEAKKAADEFQKLEDRLMPLPALTKKYYDEMEILVQAIGTDSPEAVERLRQALLLLREEYDENAKKLAENCKKLKENKECQSEEAKEMEKIWDNAMESIQESFADAFRGAFDSFDDFADGILDAFKDMIAEMLSAKLMGKLKDGLSKMFSGNQSSSGGGGGMFDSFMNMFGGGGSGGGGSGTGMFANFGSAFSASSAGGGGFFANIGAGFSGMFGGGAAAGGAGAASGAAGAAGASAGGLGGLGGAGAALMSNPWTAVIAAAVIYNAKLFEDGWRANTSDINGGKLLAGSMLTSLISPITGIVMAAVALPMLADKLLQKIGFNEKWASILSGSSIITRLFGRKAPVATAEGLELDFNQSGEIFGNSFVDWFAKGGWFRSNKRGTNRTNLSDTDENLMQIQDTFNALLDPFQQLLGALGGSEDQLAGLGGFASTGGTTRLDFHKKSEEEIAEMIQQFLVDATTRAVENYLRTTDDINETFRVTALQFAGNLELMAVALTSLANIQALADYDSLTTAQEAYAESQKTTRDKLDDAIANLRDVVAAYDASIDSLAQLEEAYSAVTAGQTALIESLLTLRDGIDGMFTDSAQQVRESLMDEEELYNLRRSQIDDLVEQAGMTTDPEELATLANEINRLGLDAFNMLDEEQRAELGPEFIEFFEGLNELFGEQIDLGISDVVAEQQALDLEVAESMDAAAQAIIDAQIAARELYERWADDFELRRGGEMHR